MKEKAPQDTVLSVFQGRAGDHNDLGIPGAAAVAAALSDQLGLSLQIIGTPEPALNVNWRPELDAAMPALQTLAKHYAAIFEHDARPITVLTRCAAALATLPIVVRHQPNVCIVWFDAHADLHTPETSTSGYLGGMAISGAADLWKSGLGGGLTLNQVILVGARDIDPAERALIESSNIRIIPSDVGCGASLISAIAGRPIYIHLDCDVLDAGIVPSDYQVKGGLSLSALRDVSEALIESEIVGIEIAEFQYAWETDGLAVSPKEFLNAIAPLVEQFRPTHITSTIETFEGG